ncbi:MAG: hypothetical protein K2I93_06855, partial [Oscillospiraceae bacterium]|nr:hypothetical protein [Oscillospiraceae bacterium]
ADLDEYDDMSLISYEMVGGSGIRKAEFIAEGRDDSIISNSSTPSAVSETAEGTFAFTSYGWGHCVGLSQNGANFYAMYAGWNYQDILFHYYPGTTLMNTGTAETELVTTQGVPGNVLQQVAEIVNCEVGPSFHPECIKAQAVAVYTYMKYHNNDAHDLKGKPNPPQELVDLCAEVLGEALYYNGNFCLTMFYASCGGITANCYDVFTADIPYLRSVSSEYDEANDPHWGDVTYYTVDEVRNRIQEAYGITLSSNPENWIRIVEGNGGYANQVVIDNQVTVRGNAFRSVMGLKSPKFTYICNVSQSSESVAVEPNETQDADHQTIGEVIPNEPVSVPDEPSTSELTPPSMPSSNDDTLTAPSLDMVLFS